MSGISCWGLLGGALDASPGSSRCQLSQLVASFDLATDFFFFFLSAVLIAMQMRVCGAALSSVLQSHPVPILALLSASRCGLQVWLKRAQECPVVFWVVSCGLPAVISEPFGNPRFQWKASWVSPAVTIHGNISWISPT